MPWGRKEMRCKLFLLGIAAMWLQSIGLVFGDDPRIGGPTPPGISVPSPASPPVFPAVQTYPDVGGDKPSYSIIEGLNPPSSATTGLPFSIDFKDGVGFKSNEAHRG
jgi:hypothetical protein